MVKYRNANGVSHDDSVIITLLHVYYILLCRYNIVHKCTRSRLIRDGDIILLYYYVMQSVRYWTSIGDDLYCFLFYLFF